MTLTTILDKLNRYNQKRRLRALVSRLPGGMQAEAMHDLLHIIDVPERSEKVSRTRGIFKALKERVESSVDNRASSLREDFEKQLERAAGNVVAPGFPIPHLRIDQNMLEQKAKAKMTLVSLEEEIMSIPETSRFNVIAAFLGASLAVAANYYTLASYFGNDWIAASETITAACNGFASIIMILFETLGLYLFLNFIPRSKSHSIAKLIGIVGAALIVVSICVMIFARTEIGTSSVTKTHDAGQVE